MKGKIHQTIEEPRVMYSLEIVSTEAKLDVAEMKKFRFALEVTRKDKIRNEHIRGAVNVGQSVKKCGTQDCNGMGI